MDSLTQIVLGAAVGEVTLGRKIGNRAMMWGAVGGTIPDLDVLGKFFLSNIDNLAFHRGISHSITFSIVGAILFGWLVHQIYKTRYHKSIAIIFKAIAAILVISAINFVLVRFSVNSYIPIALISIVIFGFLFFHSKKRYGSNWEAPEASLRDWQWLFFWTLFTHPILDCFTMYGTQLFAPFSDVRISWGTISVADPMYTIPFLICLIVASMYSRSSVKRRVWNYSGIAVSSIYLLFTVFNKQYVNNVFSDALSEQNIVTERFISNPYILSNIVWTCTAETEDYFYQGQYSLFDSGEIEFTKIEKNHDLLEDLDRDPTLKTLRWFSNDYFNVIKLEDRYQFNDLRFGSFSGKGEGPNDFIFRFLLTGKKGGGYDMEEAIGGPPEGSQDEILSKLWDRIKGKKS